MNKKQHLEEGKEEEMLRNNNEKKQKLDQLEGQLNTLGVNKGKLEEDLRKLQEDLRKLQEQLHKLEDERKDPDLSAYALAEKKVEIAEKKVEQSKLNGSNRRQQELLENAFIAAIGEANNNRETLNIAKKDVEEAKAYLKTIPLPLFLPPLVNEPPSLDELYSIELPNTFQLKDFDENQFPPIGPDEKPDLRFLSAKRPEAEKFSERLAKLEPGVIARETWIAVSGSGKTSAIFEIARKFFTIYIPCIPEGAIKQEDKSRTEREKSGSFATLQQAVKESVYQLKDNSREKTDEAKRICAAFIVSHFFILLVFLRAFPTATPIQYLFFQLIKADGQDYVRLIFKNLRYLKFEASETLARKIRRELVKYFQDLNKKPTFLLAIDEIEGAATLGNDYLSRNDHSKRGLLSPFLQAVGDLEGAAAYSSIFCGTGSSSERAQTVTSDIGKGEIDIAKVFPLATKENVYRILKLLPNVDGTMLKTLDEEIAYLVNARYRLTTRTVELFFELNDLQVRDRLKKALDLSIELHKQSLLKHINIHINLPDKTPKEDHLVALHQVYVAAKLSDGRVSFSTTLMDLCRIGLGALLMKDTYCVSEKFALEVIEDLFNQYPALSSAIEFKKSVDDVQTVILARGPSTTTKGDLFENVVFYNLLRPCFQDKPITSLPFILEINNVELDRTWGNVSFNCSRVQQDIPENQTTPNFVFNSPNVLLSPEVAHRADGVMKLDPEHIFMIGIKLYTKNVPSDLVKSQFRATNPDKVYGYAVTDELNEDFQAVRKEWNLLGLNNLKAFRIHINIPRSVIPRENVIDEIYRPGTYFDQDNSLIVNIDMSNVKSFFYMDDQTPPKEKDIVEAILRLLNYLN